MGSKQSDNTSDDRYRSYTEKREQLLKMGGEKAVEKQHKRGKLTARERIAYFFDDGTFTEQGLYVEHRSTAFGMDKRVIPAEGVITGFGKVNGRLVMTAADDFTVMAGTFGEYHGKKFAQAITRAKEMGIPFVGMNDSGGARLQEGIDTLQSYAWLFRDQIQASGIIPQIAIIMGPCLGGQAYHPIMQDFLIQCRDTGFLGIAGPAFVEAQLGQQISLEELCGVDVHAKRSGQAHFIAEDDRDALDQAKRLLSFLPPNNREKAPPSPLTDDPERIIPELDSIAPDAPMRAFDMHGVIERIVDDGDFLEVLASYAQNVIIGFGRFDGRTTGIIASQSKFKGGVIDIDSADKVSRFVRFCDLFDIPILNLHDTPGYMIGPEQEWRGILRHGAKMLYAYIEATVPKITVIVRKSYAGAYLGMCSKDTGADFVYSWPNVKLNVVGGDTAASVIFAREIRESDDPEKTRQERIEEFNEKFDNPYEAAKRGYIDDVIMPRDTRKIINRTLDLLAKKTVARPYRKYSNINL
jgi:acetyl-CoA carboxylase carboxyltransferase component